MGYQFLHWWCPYIGRGELEMSLYGREGQCYPVLSTSILTRFAIFTKKMLMCSIRIHAFWKSRLLGAALSDIPQLCLSSCNKLSKYSAPCKVPGGPVETPDSAFFWQFLEAFISYLPILHSESTRQSCWLTPVAVLWPACGVWGQSRWSWHTAGTPTPWSWLESDDSCSTCSPLGSTAVLLCQPV